MAYTDKDQQREYQRAWAQKKKRNQDGTKKLNSSVITWEDLQRYKFVKTIESFDKCVEIAKAYASQRSVDRIGIATLAERACEIKRGGKRGSKEDIRLTLTQFALNIKIHAKTIHGWLRIKKEILDKMPKNKDFAFGLATTAIRKSSHTKRTPYEEYLLLTENPKYADANRFMIYIKCLEGHTKRGTTKFLTNKEVSLSKNALRSVLSFLGP